MPPIKEATGAAESSGLSGRGGGARADAETKTEAEGWPPRSGARGAPVAGVRSDSGAIANCQWNGCVIHLSDGYAA